MWFINILVCVGFGLSSYYQGQIYKTNESMCKNYNVNTGYAYLETIKPVDICMFGKQNYDFSD